MNTIVWETVNTSVIWTMWMADLTCVVLQIASVHTSSIFKGTNPASTFYLFEKHPPEWNLLSRFPNIHEISLSFTIVFRSVGFSRTQWKWRNIIHLKKFYSVIVHCPISSKLRTFQQKVMEIVVCSHWRWFLRMRVHALKSHAGVD